METTDEIANRSMISRTRFDFSARTKCSLILTPSRVTGQKNPGNKYLASIKASALNFMGLSLLRSLFF
ncbi:MAG TPA: hypothetical protein DEA22_08415 [Blastocatellia bacterium]|nr:hypothetical protein [Blastocatellia bacterium]